MLPALQAQVAALQRTVFALLESNAPGARR